MELLILIPILTLLLHLLVSKDLVYTDIYELVEFIQKENSSCLRFIQIVLVLKLQVVSAPTNKCHC